MGAGSPESVEYTALQQPVLGGAHGRGGLWREPLSAVEAYHTLLPNESIVFQ